tara:strand:- start:1007 stop:2035 length:1029 start_codon:yes stop_codon:yes gene_type:complete
MNSKSILDEFQKKDIKLDSKQIEFLNLVEVSVKRNKKILNFMRSKKLLSIYLYGGVGIGKTILLKSIAGKLNQEFEFVHFTNFMNTIKKKLDKLDGQKNPLDKVINELKDQKRLIFIDEFQVEDVADAMIIAEIIPKLYLNEIPLFISSNSSVDELYQNGLQRERLIKSLQFIKNDFLYHYLDSRKDYRKTNSSLLNMDSSNENEIIKLIESYFGERVKLSNELILNDRKFPVKGYTAECLWINLESFFSSPVATQDFNLLCRDFNWIFLSNISILNDESMDLVRRLIAFVDIAYIANTKIKFFYPAADLPHIYIGKGLSNLWKRTASRLIEMSSQEYIIKN